MDRKLPGVSAPHVDEYAPHLLSRDQFNLRSDLWHHSTDDPHVLDDPMGPLHVGTKQAAFERESGARPWILPGRIEGELDNPFGRPVSDAYANLAAHGIEGAESANYMSIYLEEQGVIPARDESEEDSWGFDEDLPDPMRRGLYYRNDSEDAGSISAVLDPNQFRTHSTYVQEAQARGQHIPEGVALEHRYSPPADRMSDVVKERPKPLIETAWEERRTSPPLFKEVHESTFHPNSLPVGYVPTEHEEAAMRGMDVQTTWRGPHMLTTSLSEQEFPGALEHAIRKAAEPDEPPKKDWNYSASDVYPPRPSRQ